MALTNTVSTITDHKHIKLHICVYQVQKFCNIQLALYLTFAGKIFEKGQILNNSLWILNDLRGQRP